MEWNVKMFLQKTSVTGKLLCRLRLERSTCLQRLMAMYYINPAKRPNYRRTVLGTESVVPQCNEEWTVRYFRAERSELVYLKFILEAYEGMNVMSTVEKSSAIIRITSPPGFAADMELLLSELATVTRLEEVEYKPEESLHA